MTDSVLPAPPENPDSTPFYDAAEQGRFLGRRCRDCRRFHWYPRPFCPFCSGETDWEEMSGKGVIYSYSRMERVPHPYVIAYVALDEGPVMLTRLVDCPYERLAIGKAVRLVFVPSSNSRPIACFTLAE